MADVNDMMVAYAEDAVEYAAHLKKNLDYSKESVQVVEEICTLLYSSIPKGFVAKLFKKTPSEETILQMSKMMGGYVGEVIIKNYGGSWDIEDFMNQGNTTVLTIGETKIFPVARVYKRLKNGSEDNVYHYFHYLAESLKKTS
jgi:hypothetical protein